MSEKARVNIALVVTLLTWGSAFATIRVALNAFSPGHLALLRFLAASGALGLWALLRASRGHKIAKLNREDVGRVALSGALSVSVYHWFLNMGETKISAGAASFLINTAPVFSAVLAALFLGEILSRRAWFGIAVSLCGAGIIATGKIGDDQTSQSWFEPAAILVVLSALAYSVSMVLNKPLLKRYPAFDLTCYMVWFGTLILLVFVPGLVESVGAASSRALWSAIYLGVFPAALATATLSYVLARSDVARTASFFYLVPPIALLIAWLWLQEVPTARSLGGGAIILLGVVLTQWKAKTKNSTSAPSLAKIGSHE